LDAPLVRSSAAEFRKLIRDIIRLRLVFADEMVDSEK
jgi:hypothetical protein